MSDLLSAQEEKLNIEAFGELPGPRGIIVSSLCGSTNQRFAVICKGDFPFPFQTSDQIDESEVKRTDRRQDGSGYERHYDKMPYPQVYQSSDPQEFHRGADCRENGCSRKVLLISFSNQQEIKRACHA